MNGKNVVLGITGGIAAYRAAQIAREMTKRGAHVYCILTRNATNFITQQTMETLTGNPAVVDMFARPDKWEVEHIALAKRADVFLVAPASANFIGKVASGVADDMLTTTVMATRAPLLIAPAMNSNMYENPVTQRNMQTLKTLLHAQFIEPKVGLLACNDVGKGHIADDEAILAMTDDNLRQRETILPSEKALSLKMQYEAIKHQGARGDSAEAGKLSLESVGQRNGMSVKTVQRYIWLNDLVPELKQTMDDGKLSFTPAVEISRVRPKHQKYIAVSIEGQQASPSKGQAKRLRELDKENKLSPDVIDGILCEEKKKEDRDVIITGAELEKFFGKEATPRQMKDQIMTLLEDWKERQPPELAKPDKKMDMEK